MRDVARFGLVCLACVGLAAPSQLGCSTYQDTLARGQRAFEGSEHERALAIFRGLEPDLGRLTLEERAHYAYLRGMTDYRMGYQAEARHWLSLGAAIEQQSPGSLPAEWAKRAADSLKELNEQVYSAGIAALSNNGSAAKGKAGEGGDGDVGPSSDTDKKPAAKPTGD
jgi:hypothetical protein